MNPKYDVFVSYCREDAPFVKHLVADLKDHHVKVWFDTVELRVGDTFRQSIETAIRQSRFFCFVISDASLKSYFAREIELESAFAKMAQERQRTFILPLRLRCTRKIPLQLSTYQYLDFSTPAMYRKNLKPLIDRLLLTDDRFTGSLMYKNVDTSMTGTMVGVGEPLKQETLVGSYVRVFFENGQIRTMETYEDGKANGAKSVIYDTKGRVSEIVLFRNNKVIDTWRYEYDLRSGFRKYKWVCRPGEHAHQRLTYDRNGNKTSEANIGPDGTTVQTGGEGWAIKRYVRNASGDIVKHEYLDANEKLLRSEPVK